MAADLPALNDPDGKPECETANPAVHAVPIATPDPEDGLCRRHHPDGRGSGPAHGRTGAHIGAPMMITSLKTIHFAVPHTIPVVSRRAEPDTMWTA